jgi:predicted transcriptional regulator
MNKKQKILDTKQHMDDLQKQVDNLYDNLKDELITEKNQHVEDYLFEYMFNGFHNIEQVLEMLDDE